MPGSLAALAAAWRDPASFNSRSARAFCEMLQAASGACRPGQLDLLVVGTEASLWLAEQFCLDFKVGAALLLLPARSSRSKAAAVMPHGTQCPWLRLAPQGQVLLPSQQCACADDLPHAQRCQHVSQQGPRLDSRPDRQRAVQQPARQVRVYAQSIGLIHLTNALALCGIVKHLQPAAAALQLWHVQLINTCHAFWKMSKACTVCRTTRESLRQHHTVALCLSQSGQTFPTLHTARLLQQHLPGRVFICSRYMLLTSCAGVRDVLGAWTVCMHCKLQLIVSQCFFMRAVPTGPLTWRWLLLSARRRIQ